MKGLDPSRMVQVDEIVGDADIQIGAIRVRAVRNSHSAPGHPTAKEAPILIAGAHEKYKGDVEVARDLDRF